MKPIEGAAALGSHGPIEYLTDGETALHQVRGGGDPARVHLEVARVVPDDVIALRSHRASVLAVTGWCGFTDEVKSLSGSIPSACE